MEIDTIGICELPEGAPDWAAARDTDTSYQAVMDEIARMSSMTESTSAPPNWELIVKNGTDILANKAKDIQIATYAAAGMMNTQGITGFSNGVRILGDILGTHSDTAFPPKKRKRARINAIQWWLERAVAWFSSASPGEIAYDFSEELGDRIKTLDEVLSANFEDDAPLLAELQSRIQMVPVAPPPPEPEETTEPEDVAAVEIDGEEDKPAASATKSSSAGRPSPVLPPSVDIPDNADEARKTIAALLTSAVSAAAIISAETNSDPLPYRLRRLAAWSSIRKSPPAEEGRTLLPAPESHIVQALNSLAASGDYAEALALAEEQVGVYLFWLDPQRVAAQALVALGASHRLAQAAVEMETLQYLSRIPSLTKLSFTDGTPFADAKTRSWLAELSDKGGSGGGSQDNPAVKEALDKAKELSAASPEDALAILSQAGSVAGHPRDTLLLRVEVLKIFIASGRPEAAQAQIGMITETLDRFNLDIWDSELASRALCAALSALPQDESSELHEQLRNRLALCSPLQYLRST